MKKFLGKRFVEFFEVKGVLAMRNLTIFITILVSSLAIMWLTVSKQLTWEIFLGYLSAGGGVYSFGKWQDDKTRRTEINNQTDDTDAAPVDNSVSKK